MVCRIDKPHSSTLRDSPVPVLCPSHKVLLSLLSASLTCLLYESNGEERERIGKEEHLPSNPFQQLIKLMVLENQKEAELG